MIFAHTLDGVISSQKTQTRRLVKPNEVLNKTQTLLGETVFVHVPGKRKMYEVGKSYAVQPGRGKKAVARMVITELRCERVKDISAKDARAEGFKSRKEFFATWRNIHGANADLDAKVWVISFKLEGIVANELKSLYEQRISTNQSIDHSHDIPAPIARVSGTRLHGGNHGVDGVGTPLSH